MVFAEDIRKMILQMAEERGPHNGFEPSEVAQALDPNNWKMLVDQVTLVADSLISEGEIVPDPTVNGTSDGGSIRWKKSRGK